MGRPALVANNVCTMELRAGRPHKKGNRRGAACVYNIKALRSREIEFAQQAQRSYERFVGAWLLRVPAQPAGCRDGRQAPAPHPGSRSGTSEIADHLPRKVLITSCFTASTALDCCPGFSSSWIQAFPRGGSTEGRTTTLKSAATVPSVITVIASPALTASRMTSSLGLHTEMRQVMLRRLSAASAVSRSGQLAGKQAIASGAASSNTNFGEATQCKRGRDSNVAGRISSSDVTMGEIQLALARLILEDPARLTDDIQLDAGVSVMQMLAQPGKQLASVILADPQPHPPRDLSGRGPVNQTIVRLNERPSMGKQVLAGRGNPNIVAAAVEQPLAELVFQRSYPH